MGSVTAGRGSYHIRGVPHPQAGSQLLLHDTLPNSRGSAFQLPLDASKTADRACYPVVKPYGFRAAPAHCMVFCR